MNSDLQPHEINALVAAGLTPTSGASDNRGGFEVRPSAEWLERIKDVDGFRIVFEGGDFIAYRKS